MPESARKWVTAYLGLGSSVGDRRQHLRDALQRLTETPENQDERENVTLRLIAVSPIYESPHLGLEPGDATRYPPHLNGVAHIETRLAPDALLARIQDVERRGGRERQVRWGPRTIDIDILLYGTEPIETDRLCIPHPGLKERAFVVVPLFALAPDLMLPDGTRLRDVRFSDAIERQTLVEAGDELSV